jgi:hypothetical protein
LNGKQGPAYRERLALHLERFGYRFRGVALGDYNQSINSHKVLLGVNFGY